MVVPMCCVVGPFIEYQDYKHFLEEEGRFKRIPNSTVPALKNFGQGIGSLLINLILPGLTISIYNMHTAWFTEANFIVKMVYIYLAMLAARCLYYIAWKLTDSALTISGISYDETTKDFEGI